MAQILTQRSLVLAKTEAVFGELETPSPSTDALLAQEPDFSIDFTQIERNFARQSISPLPIAAGRKIASISFQHEVRGNGDTGTAPRVGRLLQSCGYAETQVTATAGVTNGNTAITAGAGNTGDDMLLAGGPTQGGSNAVIADATYRARIVTAGGTGVAQLRVTGGRFEDDKVSDSSQEKDAVFTETFCLDPVTTQSGSFSGSAVVDDTTDPTSVTYDVSGYTNLTTGDTFRVVVLGIPFLVTLSTGTATDDLADDIASAIDAHPDFVAPNPAASVITVTFTGNAAPSTLTSGSTTITWGASGHTTTIGTFTTADLNDSWTVVTKPVGFEYTPVSTGFNSLTLFLYFDGILHRMSGARGTFTVEGTGGELALWEFTFTGNFETVQDAALPSATFETTIPSQVELAQLAVNKDVDETPTSLGVTCDSWNNAINGTVSTLCAAAFSLDQANEVVPRQCINDPDSFNGVLITGRAPTGTFDPELELVATHDFWNILATADVLEWRVRVGTVRANIVRFESDSAQYAGLSYEDRDGLRVLSVDLRFSASSPSFSDDEILIAFN